MVRTSDPRYQRSRQALRDALIRLSHDDPASLTVSALCEASGIDRSTFYRHAPDIEHLAADTIASLADQAAGDWVAIADGSGTQVEESFTLSQRYWRHIEDNRALYRWALGPTGSAAAMNAVLSSFTRGVWHELRLLEPDAESDELERRARLIAGAMFATCLGWIADEDPVPADEIAAWVLRELIARFSVEGSQPSSSA